MNNFCSTKLCIYTLINISTIIVNNRDKLLLSLKNWNDYYEFYLSISRVFKIYAFVFFKIWNCKMNLAKWQNGETFIFSQYFFLHFSCSSLSPRWTLHVLFCIYELRTVRFPLVTACVESHYIQTKFSFSFDILVIISSLSQFCRIKSYVYIHSNGIIFTKSQQDV